MERNQRETVLARLEQLKSAPIMDINTNDVREYHEIHIDKNADPESRVMSLIEQTGNPYVYRDGDALVKVNFAKTGKTLQSCLEEYLTAEVLMNR